MAVSVWRAMNELQTRQMNGIFGCIIESDGGDVDSSGQQWTMLY